MVGLNAIPFDNIIFFQFTYQTQLPKPVFSDGAEKASITWRLIDVLIWNEFDWQKNWGFLEASSNFFSSLSLPYFSSLFTFPYFLFRMSVTPFLCRGVWISPKWSYHRIVSLAVYLPIFYLSFYQQTNLHL